MTLDEFSNEFDILYNSVMSNQAPGLDEYEKSVFLTLALEQIVKSYFNPKLNKVMEGFDGSKRRLMNFANLILTDTATLFEGAEKFCANSKAYKLPSDMFIILNESIVKDTTPYTVIPISFSDYDLLMQKPYPYPPKRLVWRLFTSTDGENIVAEVIGKFGEGAIYNVRYLKRPQPIILKGVDSGLTINGIKASTDGSDCELDKSLHKEISQRAVELAKAAYTGDLNAQIALGSASQTDIGYVPQNNDR